MFEGFPAQKADIRPGDQLVKINDIDLDGKNNDQVSLLLKGTKALHKTIVKRDDAASLLKKTLCAMRSNNPMYPITVWLMAIWVISSLINSSKTHADEVTNALDRIKKE